MNIKRSQIEILQAERGITQAELAAQAKISRQCLSTIIRRGTCTPKTAGRLAAALDVPVAEITKE